MTSSREIVILCVSAVMVLTLIALQLRLRAGRKRSPSEGRPSSTAPINGKASLPVAAYRWIATGRRRLLLGGLVLGLILLAVGVQSVVYGARIIQDARVSLSWPTVRGQVTESTVSTDNSDGFIEYRASVTYEYTVGGQQYVGSRICFLDEIFPDPEPARDRAAQYPVGASVDVFYRPDDPWDAVLEPGASQIGLWTVSGLGGCCSLMGILVGGMGLMGMLRGGKAKRSGDRETVEPSA
jgi:hypothetical protein